MNYASSATRGTHTAVREEHVQFSLSTCKLFKCADSFNRIGISKH